LLLLLPQISFSPFVSAPERDRNLRLTIAEFRDLLGSLSEPEGYFDTDNYISNEAGYLKIMPALRRLNIHGGVFVGVGPDQNYSYIAEIKPQLAIIIDIRRQNALQHLYFKSLVQLSSNRVGYIGRLFGRKLIAPTRGGRLTISELLALVDAAPREDGFAAAQIDESVRLIDSWRLGLHSGDLESIRKIANAFVAAGPELRFTSYNRPPRAYYPSLRQLLEETDAEGVHASYLADEDRFQTVKGLHAKNLILPVVGDLSGSLAMARISRELRRRGLELECFYVSNVEFYLSPERWDSYLRNLEALPRTKNAYLIRSYANGGRSHPAGLPGYYMTTLLAPMNDFLEMAASRNASYWDLVTRDYVAR
jgi:hypothetical protein